MHNLPEGDKQKGDDRQTERGTNGKILVFIVGEGMIVLNNYIFRDKLHLIAGAGWINTNYKLQINYYGKYND